MPTPEKVLSKGQIVQRLILHMTPPEYSSGITGVGWCTNRMDWKVTEVRSGTVLVKCPTCGNTDQISIANLKQ